MKVVNGRPCFGVQLGRAVAGDIVELNGKHYVVTNDTEMEYVTVVDMASGEMSMQNNSVWCIPLVAELYIK